MHQPKLAKLLLFSLLLLLTHIASANAIDDLKNDGDVKRFMVVWLKKTYKIKEKDIAILPADSLFVNSGCYEEARKMDCKTWEKADFNNDGKTDLLVNVAGNGFNRNLMAVIDNGNNSFKLLNVVRKNYGLLPDLPLAKPILINGVQVLLYHACSGRHFSANKKSSPEKTDTLIFKFGNFVEYNPKSATVAITNIHVETTMCFGKCPVFKLDIAADGAATYSAEKFNPETGFFKGTIEREKLTQIISLINYIDIKNLNTNYDVNWTDDQTIKLSVQFADGSSKQITDYGMQGTYGLRYLYQIFFGLRSGQTWYE
jgi:hypothetical protein